MYFLLLLLLSNQALCSGSSIGSNTNICPTVLRSIHLELPVLPPEAVPRVSSLVKRCAGVAWPVHLYGREQRQRQHQHMHSVLRVVECIHVIFFTPEEPAASSYSSLISSIMRSRANIFPVPPPFARQSHVTILGLRFRALSFMFVPVNCPANLTSRDFWQRRLMAARLSDCKLQYGSV